MKLLIVTDAWQPQTNGVVTTLGNIIAQVRERGVSVVVAEPGAYRTFPCPGYGEIRLVGDPWRVGRLLEEEAPDAVHIATEGPLGLAARAWLVRHGIAFSTSLHTKLPEYVSERLPVPTAWGYAYLRWFHRPAAATLVTTASHRRELAGHGLSDLVVWGRGVDTALFRPAVREARARPRLLYVGRIALEKNIEAFLRLDVDAEKIVVGDGPQRTALEARYPSARWLGYRRGEALVRCYADADAFVFPSRTDTFGLVMLEAMACGTPVAAYPVTGPIDVITPRTGALDEDLGTAVAAALDVDRGACRAEALRYDWQVIADRFLDTVAIGRQRGPSQTSRLLRRPMSRVSLRSSTSVMPHASSIAPTSRDSRSPTASNSS